MNIVAWPEQMYLIPAWAEMFRSHGLRFHVDPYSSIAYYPYEYSEAERRFLEPWIWENRRAGLDFCDRMHPSRSCALAASITSTSSPTAPRGAAFSNGNLGSTRWAMCWSQDSSSHVTVECAECWQCPACDRDKVMIVTNL